MKLTKTELQRIILEELYEQGSFLRKSKEVSAPTLPKSDSKKAATAAKKKARSAAYGEKHLVAPQAPPTTLKEPASEWFQDREGGRMTPDEWAKVGADLNKIPRWTRPTSQKPVDPKILARLGFIEPGEFGYEALKRGWFSPKFLALLRNY